MPPTLSPLFRLRLSALGEDLNSWGDPNLNNALKLIEEAVAGPITLTITGDRTLTADNYISNEYRHGAHYLVGTPAADFVITVPTIAFPYRFVNRTGRQATIKTASGVAAVVRVGMSTVVLCDGTDCVALDPTLDKVKAPAANVAMAGFKFTGMGAGTAATDSATLSNRIEQFAAPQAALPMNGQRITGLGATGADTDAISRGEVSTLTAASVQLASDWAQKISGTVDGSGYSAKLWATSTALLGVTGFKGAYGYANDASASATAAAGSASLAQSWATSTTVVSGGFKGAFGYAQDASGSATSAATTLTNFDKRYLGAKTADPTLDNQGAALSTGALYFNTTAGEMRTYTGSAWIAAYVSSANIVSGPASSVADAITLFSGTTGKVIKDSGYTFGSASDLLANTANKASLNSVLWSAQAFVTITYAATTTPNLSTFLNGTITLTGNLTLANPTNAKAGQSGFIRLVQDATGTRTVAFGTAWKFNGGPPTASTAANAVDAISYVVVDAATPVLNCAFLKAIA